MNCKRSQLLMIPHIVGDPDLTRKQQRRLTSHLNGCRDCREEYNDTKDVVNLIQSLKETSVREDISGDGYLNPVSRLDTELGLTDLWEQIADYEKQKLNRLRKIWSTAAAAAWLLFGIVLWSVLPGHGGNPEKVTTQAATRINSPLVVEAILDNGRINVAAGQRISTNADELMTLLINSKHKMIMDRNTALAITPFAEGERLGCLVNLASGQIYTRVEHDGDPFIVDTAHGKAVIIGTIFDVKVTDTDTTLVVAEGNVQFESESRTVKVGAGQQSWITGRSTPSKPVSCNTAEFTAWATGYKSRTALTKINSSTDSHLFDDLEITVTGGPIDLGGVDYDYWVEENRAWFKQQFPQVFQLKKALSKEGIEVDYPELLIQGGDIWQFVFPASTNHQIPVLSQESLMRICSHYGCDDKRLLEAIPAVKDSSGGDTATRDKFFGLEAFEEWSKSLEKAKKPSTEQDSDVLRYSFHAGVYIIKTRSLAWLCAQKDMFKCQTQDKSRLLSFLQDEIKAADSLLQITTKAMVASRNPCTGEIPHLNEQIECLARIHDIEKQLTEYKDEIIEFGPFQK